MKKNKFIKSSIILIIGGFITKIIGMIIKVYLTNVLGIKGIGLYTMAMPTYLLLISISGLGLTTALNVLISTNKYNNKNLIITAIKISLFIDLVIYIIIFFSYKYIGTYLLNNPELNKPILVMSFILPFISISNIFRSYYFAKEKMIPHVVTNILEDLIKLLLLFLFINHFNSIENKISFVLLTNIVCEMSSILIFIGLFPKYHISKADRKINNSNIKDLFKIAIPTTLSRLVGSITYFLEPIILNYVLLYVGYTNDYIIKEYGIINGYVLPIIMLPSFFTNAISQALIPIISKNYINHNYKEVKRKLYQCIYISIILGVIFTSVFIIFGKNILKILYHTNKGLNYLHFVAPIFIFHYIEHPLLATLQAMNKAKINLKISLINMFIRTIILALLSLFKIGLYGLLISLIINILFSCIYSKKYINKLIKNK